MEDINNITIRTTHSLAVVLIALVMVALVGVIVGVAKLKDQYGVAFEQLNAASRPVVYLITAPIGTSSDGFFAVRVTGIVKTTYRSSDILWTFQCDSGTGKIDYQGFLPAGIQQILCKYKVRGDYYPQVTIVFPFSSGCDACEAVYKNKIHVP